MLHLINKNDCSPPQSAPLCHRNHFILKAANTARMSFPLTKSKTNRAMIRSKNVRVNFSRGYISEQVW